MGRVAAGVRGIALRRTTTSRWRRRSPPTTRRHPRGRRARLRKRTRVKEFRIQGRGGSGIALMKVTAKTGNVAGMRHVSDEDDILLITSKGMMIRTRAAEVRRTGRATQGVKLMGLEADDHVVAVAKLVEREEEEVAASQPS